MRDLSDVPTGEPGGFPPHVSDRRCLVPWHELQLSGLADIAPSIDQALRALGDYGYSDRDSFAVRLALHEALTNALRHGNGLDPALVVRLRFALTHDEFLAEVEDEGPGFDPADVTDPTEGERLTHRGGRGVFLMRRYMTRVRFSDRGNCVTLSKRRGARAALNAD